MIRISVGEIISWIDRANIACRGRSQYLNGSVNHSFQLITNENKIEKNVYQLTSIDL